MKMIKIAEAGFINFLLDDHLCTMLYLYKSFHLWYTVSELDLWSQNQYFGDVLPGVQNIICNLKTSNIQ